MIEVITVSVITPVPENKDVVVLEEYSSFLFCEILIVDHSEDPLYIVDPVTDVPEQLVVVILLFLNGINLKFYYETHLQRRMTMYLR